MHIVPVFTVLVFQCVCVWWGVSLVTGCIPAQISAVRHSTIRTMPHSTNRAQTGTLTDRRESRWHQWGREKENEKSKLFFFFFSERDVMPAAIKSSFNLSLKCVPDCDCVCGYVSVLVCVCVCLWRFSVCFDFSHFNMNTLSSIDLLAHQSHAPAFKGLPYISLFWLTKNLV